VRSIFDTNNSFFCRQTNFGVLALLPFFCDTASSSLLLSRLNRLCASPINVQRWSRRRGDDETCARIVRYCAPTEIRQSTVQGFSSLSLSIGNHRSPLCLTTHTLLNPLSRLGRPFTRTTLVKAKRLYYAPASS
jgi:hypothetical protein